RIQVTYAAAVSYLDTGLGLLVEELKHRELLDQVLLVVTSDRGCPLGEHGWIGESRPWLHEELVHLPLILRLPGAAAAGPRISALTQPVDLAPTLLEAFGLPARELHGHSLFPLVRGQAPAVRDYACSGLRREGCEEWALRTGEWCLLVPGRQPPGEPERGK